jgi:hypothetical protein
LHVLDCDEEWPQSTDPLGQFQCGRSVTRTNARKQNLLFLPLIRLKQSRSVGMIGRAHDANATLEKIAAKAAVAMHQLRRQALWGCAAAGALLLAVFASRTEIGSHRAAIVLASLNWASSAALGPGQVSAAAAGQSAAPAFETDGAAGQLAHTVRALSEDRDRMMTRLAAIEHNLDDITGSIANQTEASRAATAQTPASWSGPQPPVLVTPTTIDAIAAAVAPPIPPAFRAEPSPPPFRAEPSPPMPVASLPAAERPPSAVAPPATATYGVDIASGSSIKTLQARWVAARSAHAEIFSGLRPVVALHENPRSKHIDLRLVLGPFATAAAAAQFCVSLEAFGQPCEPTMYDSHGMALEQIAIIPGRARKDAREPQPVGPHAWP